MKFATIAAGLTVFHSPDVDCFKIKEKPVSMLCLCYPKSFHGIDYD